MTTNLFNFIRATAFGVTLMASFAANAGFTRGKLVNLHFMPTGAMLVYLTTPLNGKAACNSAYRFAIDATSAAGKVQAAALLSAYMSGTVVEITGNGTCQVWGDSEDIQFFSFPE